MAVTWQVQVPAQLLLCQAQRHLNWVIILTILSYEHPQPLFYEKICQSTINKVPKLILLFKVKSILIDTTILHNAQERLSNMINKPIHFLLNQSEKSNKSRLNQQVKRLIIYVVKRLKQRKTASMSNTMT